MNCVVYISTLLNRLRWGKQCGEQDDWRMMDRKVNNIELQFPNIICPKIQYKRTAFSALHPKRRSHIVEDIVHGFENNDVTSRVRFSKFTIHVTPCKVLSALIVVNQCRLETPPH